MSIKIDSDKHSEVDAALVGKLFVTQVNFKWNEDSKSYNSKTGNYDKKPGHWAIRVNLGDKPTNYGTSTTMEIEVERGIGQKLAEVLLPVVIADASRKAEQLAADSKAMFAALGERTVQCLAEMPSEGKE